MPVTIYDIAKALDTTHATVSRGLRDDPSIAVATRSKIKLQAVKMGYQPNHLSKALAGGKSMTIGVIAGSIEARITVLRLRAIESQGRDKGYLTYLTGWGDDYSREDRTVAGTVRNLLQRRVDGLIIYHVIPLPRDAQRLLQKAAVPVVHVDWSPENESRAIHIDHTQALLDLAQQMADYGHRRAALVHTPFDVQYSARKMDIMRGTLSKAGIALETSGDWVVPKGSDFESGGYEVIRRQLNNDSVPSLILASNDEQAAGVIAGLQDAGCQIPKDFSVVGFDDSPIASLYRPALTTIHQPREEVGVAAFDMLEELMSGSKQEAEPLTFHSNLITRQSTGLAPDVKS